LSWTEAKATAFLNQGGICPICEQPLKITNCTGHHKINRAQRGPDTAENCEVRHGQCERYMHLNYPYGNFEGNLGGNEMGRSAKKRRASHARRYGYKPQVFTPPCETVRETQTQFVVIGATYLDTTLLGENTVKLSLDGNNVKALVTIGGNNDRI
jgi:hypothetical protein